MVRYHGLKRLALVAACLSSAAPALPASLLDAPVPITIFDELGVARPNELVTVLVPFAEQDAIAMPQWIRVANENDVEVPVQWKTLQRWHAPPNAYSAPIRFALAQFRVALAPGQTRVHHLRRRVPSDGPPAAPLQQIKWYATTGGAVVLDTGPLELSILPGAANLFLGAQVDLNGDGVVTAGETVSMGGSVGAALVDPFGAVYLGAGDPSVRWYAEELGPLKIVFRADCAHVPWVGGIPRDYLRMTTRYTLEAGSAAVRVEHVLRNTYLSDPLGPIAFRRYLLHTRVSGSGPVVATFGSEDDTLAAHVVDLSQTPSAFTYQDSSGKSTWQQQAGTTFSGWRLYTGPSIAEPSQLLPSVPTTAPLASGAQNAGWMDVTAGDRGVLVALRYPWQNYPFALRASAQGDVVVDLWPAEFAGTHWLDDAQRKAHHLVYRFHGAGVTPATEARRLVNPLRPLIDLSYFRATRAWADQGDLRDPGLPLATMRDNAAQRYYEHMIKVKVEGGFGWQNFGESVAAKNTHTTGSPRNKLTYFDRYVSSGVRDWFRMQEAFALHSMDLRTYHIDGFQAAAHPGAKLVEGLPYSSGSDMLGRDQIPSWLDAYRMGIPPGGHGWNGFDAEHMVVDDLYEYYLLTGSPAALDAMRKIGEAMKTWDFDPSKPIVSSRAIGWCLRALMKIYAVTGDPGVLQEAQDLVEVVHNFRGQTSSPETGIVYHYLARQIYGGGTHGMTEDYDLPWQIAVGIYGLALYHRETQDPSVPPVIADLARYIAQHGVVDGVVVDALACDNHLDNNPKWSNTGVNTWIASALAIAYRTTGDPELRALGEAIFLENKSGFLENGSYSWLHSMGEVLEEGE